MAGRWSVLHAANQSSIVLLLFESYEGVLRLADRVLALLLEPDGRIILSYDWRQTNATLVENSCCSCTVLVLLHSMHTVSASCRNLDRVLAVQVSSVASSCIPHVLD